jgi:glycosyltransferase involved in cell wall biosynthesis
MVNDEFSPTTLQPIRVLRIIARMNVGGPAVQVSGLMRGLSDSFDHTLLTGFCGENESDYLTEKAKDVKAIRISGLGRDVRLFADIKALFSIVRTIRKLKPHIIHTHTFKAGVIGRLASLISLHKSIRIHTYHGHLLHGYFGSIKTNLVIAIERSLSHFTHQLLSVGDIVRADLIKVKIGKIDKFALMPPGLIIDELPSQPESQTFFGLHQNRLQCAFIGRVTQIKRPDRFLDVVSEIKRRGVCLDFIIAGDGELLESCKARIIMESLPVRTLGWQVDIEKVLAASDMVLLTSDNEGTPLSLIQAGMAGIPVVATNVGSVSEVVLNGVTGLITDKDVNEISDALEKLASNKELRAQIGENAKNFTLSHFGVQRLVQDHENLYLRLIMNPTKS